MPVLRALRPEVPDAAECARSGRWPSTRRTGSRRWPISSGRNSAIVGPPPAAPAGAAASATAHASTSAGCSPPAVSSRGHARPRPQPARTSRASGERRTGSRAGADPVRRGRPRRAALSRPRRGRRRLVEVRRVPRVRRAATAGESRRGRSSRSERSRRDRRQIVAARWTLPSPVIGARDRDQGQRPGQQHEDPAEGQDQRLAGLFPARLRCPALSPPNRPPPLPSHNPVEPTPHGWRDQAGNCRTTKRRNRREGSAAAPRTISDGGSPVLPRRPRRSKEPECADPDRPARAARRCN